MTCGLQEKSRILIQAVDTPRPLGMFLRIISGDSCCDSNHNYLLKTVAERKVGLERDDEGCRVDCSCPPE